MKAVKLCLNDQFRLANRGGVIFVPLNCKMIRTQSSSYLFLEYGGLLRKSRKQKITVRGHMEGFLISQEKTTRSILNLVSQMQKLSRSEEMLIKR